MTRIAWMQVLRRGAEQSALASDFLLLLLTRAIQGEMTLRLVLHIAL